MYISPAAVEVSRLCDVWNRLLDVRRYCRWYIGTGVSLAVNLWVGFSAGEIESECLGLRQVIVERR